MFRYSPDDYWIGLLQQTEGHFVWVSDCTNLTYIEYVRPNWASDKQCLKFSKTNHEGDHEGCHSDRAFICQIPREGKVVVLFGFDSCFFILYSLITLVMPPPPPHTHTHFKTNTRMYGALHTCTSVRPSVVVKLVRLITGECYDMYISNFTRR